jgi:acetyl-CoA carboxylase carboxyl transferase subunit beta
MGSVAGEKITRAFELATKKGLPIITITASGGARMQEGVYSLMQMSKTASAVYKHSRKRLLYISVLSNPTLGGVTASFASLGDIIIAEENAQIGFTGKRIIEETIRATLSDDFQTAKYIKEHGFADIVAGEDELRPILAKILQLHS